MRSTSRNSSPIVLPLLENLSFRVEFDDLELKLQRLHRIGWSVAGILTSGKFRRYEFIAREPRLKLVHNGKICEINEP